MNKVEKLKSEGKYREAGELAFNEGQSDAYGCHYGMRSDRQFAINEFRAGYEAARIVKRDGEK